jgi:hypothetical protein
MAPERTPEPVVEVPGVAFEVERFEWVAPDRLEVAGRWFGLRGHRFLRPTLDVEVAGERRRMLAVLEHKPWAAEEGEEWLAAFEWAGAPAKLDDAELTVSPDLSVQLPLPEADDSEVEATVPAGERRPARRPRTAILEGELAAALAEVERLNDELDSLRESHSEAARELRERARTAQEDASRLETELGEARERIAAVEEEADRRTAAAEEDAARQVEQAREEREAATAASDAARAEAAAAHAERDAALKKLAAAESERESLVEQRDRARQERNAWMSRARAASSSRGQGAGAVADRVPTPPEPPTPPQQESVPGPAAEPRPAPSERRTIQIGERPGPLRPAPMADHGPRPSREIWTPRLVAALALAAFVLVIVLLLLLAL